MKNFLFIILLIAPIIAQSQVVAGVVPNGSSLVTLNSNLYATVPYGEDSIRLDLDCDNIGDVTIHLFAGNMWSDRPNLLSVRRADSSLRFCWTDTNTLAPASFITWHQSNEPIVCDVNYNWKHSEVYFTGHYSDSYLLAMQFVPHPTYVSRKPHKSELVYFGYNKIMPDSTERMGWIAIDFDLTDGYFAVANVYSHTALCAPLNVPNASLRHFKVYPTIVQDQIIIESKVKDILISILSPSGHIIKRERLKEIGKKSISMQFYPSGIYFVQVKTEEGKQVFKVIKD